MPRKTPTVEVLGRADGALREQAARTLERKVARRGEQVAGSDITTSGSQDIKTPGMRGAPRVRDRDGAEMRQTTLHLPVPLFKRLGRYCVDADRGMNESIVDALTEFLDAREVPEAS